MFKDGNGRFTTVPLIALSDQLRNRHHAILKADLCFYYKSNLRISIAGKHNLIIGK